MCQDSCSKHVAVDWLGLGGGVSHPVCAAKFWETCEGGFSLPPGRASLSDSTLAFI